MRRPAAWLLVLTLGAAPAAEPVDGLEIGLTPWTRGWRADAPLLLDLSAASTRGSRRGRVEAVIEEAGEALAVWRSDELILAGGRLQRVIALPPLPAPASPWRGTGLTARLRWIEGYGAVELGIDTLIDADAPREAILLCLDGGISESERLGPPPPGCAAARRPVEDLPAQALAYCAFALVALGEQQAAHLRREQREALAAWVAAGGDLLLAWPGTADPAWLPAAGHRLGTVRRDGGLAPRSASTAPPDWQEALGASQPPLPPTATLLRWGAGFVAVVGPLEWAALALLRRRRWTWATYPLATLAVAGGVVWWAERTWGAGTGESRLLLLDADAAGAVRRATTIACTRNAASELREDAGEGELAARRLAARQAAAPELSGSAAGRWSRTQRLDQWVLRLDRTTRFAPGPAPWRPDGEAVGLAGGSLPGAPAPLFDLLLATGGGPPAGGPAGADLLLAVPAATPVRLAWRRDPGGWTVLRQALAAGSPP